MYSILVFITKILKGPIFFWGLVLVLKLYVYTSLVRIFKRTAYRRMALGLGFSSFLATGLGLYTLVYTFSKGISNPSLFSNFSLALMISFGVCELLLVMFFLVDDIWGIGRWAHHRVKTKKDGSPLLERRKFIKKTGVLLGAIPFSSFLHGITLGKYNFKVHEQQLFFDNLPDAFDGFRIAQISDVHAGSFDSQDAVRKGVEMLQDQKADVILFTGDLVNAYASEIEPYLSVFKNLNAPYGKFAVLGNHDYPMHRRMFENDEHGQENLEKIKAHHATMGFDVLLNRSTKLEKDGQYICLAGVENWGRSRHFPKLGDLDIATADCKKDDFIVLLSHDPTHWEDKVKTCEKPIHLTLSGHTHGMQMGVDLPMFKWSPVKYVYQHWAGLYEEAGRYLYVNRGFGFLGFAGRVGVFPEITVLELRKGNVVG